jgi:hypothetical protein
MRLDVNTDAAIIFTAKLEKLHRSAFPSAVRNTLNDAAFETKKLVPKKANEKMTIRQKNVFSKFTVIDKAKGFDIRRMSSVVGIDGRSKSKLADGLEKQETGGNVTSRKLIAHDMGRISGSYSKKLKAKNQFSKIGSIAGPGKRKKGSKYIMIKKSSAKGTVFEVSGKKLTPIFSYRKSKISKLKARPFMKPSAVQASKKIESIYKNNAEFQFKKHLK